MNRLQQSNEDSQIQEGQQVSQHSQESEFIKVKYAGRKNLCQNCNNVLAKYTCPKCQLKTCSLSCTRKHKEIKQCSGQKDPTQYISRNSITEKIVQKDYNFIEDMISGADKVKKVLSGVNNTINLEPRRFKILRNNARQLYGIKLSNGPNILERHRQNISFFFVKTKSIYWVLQLIYVEKVQKAENNFKSSKSSTKLTTSSVITQPISDQKTFVQALQQNYLNKALLEQRQINTTKRQEFLVFFQNKENFEQNYKSNERKSNVVISERISSGKFMTHFELIQYKIQQKINEQMVDVSIFQFPSLYVVHKSMRQEFLKGYKDMKFSKHENKHENAHKKQKIRNNQRQRSRQKGFHSSPNQKKLHSSPNLKEFPSPKFNQQNQKQQKQVLQ